MYRYIFKPLLDFITGVILFLLLTPIFIVIMIVLYTSLKKNPFFVQKRPGKNEKIFSALKFKSMLDTVDDKGDLLPDHLRITKFGAFLRKSSLDEIPQILNVIKGDMSFVGPRPLLIRYLPYYSQREKLRHSVKPGITGLAQVSGRNYISWKKKFELDVHYAENLSLFLDLKILFKTVLKVLYSSDVAVATNKVNEYFDVERKRELEQV
ncbi:sugar transferase [Costertonia aggregata]|uniref:Sugar transferase n=1 Tax=Costertonia aggregata TaxID=343403 RepID=A0A7H9AT88_9FLAO|nr:sugar transferase [Costertonia aggregata]QLG46688.1 sugar transferase [Costertonia aggregata]